MARRYRDQSFRKTDVVRAWRAAQSAGVANPRLVINTVKGTIEIQSGEPSKDGVLGKGEPTPLEQWRAKRSGQG